MQSSFNCTVCVTHKSHKYYHLHADTRNTHIQKASHAHVHIHSFTCTPTCTLTHVHAHITRARTYYIHHTALTWLITIIYNSKEKHVYIHTYRHACIHSSSPFSSKARKGRNTHIYIHTYTALEKVQALNLHTHTHTHTHIHTYLHSL